jgi:hypothetical protein
MNIVSPAHAEEALTHLTHQFAQWRQSRTTPCGRSPQPLRAQAVRLARVLPCARVAKHLGLTPPALKQRRDATGSALAPTPPPHSPHFVEVAAAWRTPTAEVEVQRPDGTSLRITYSAPSPLSGVGF